jgi:hypothetical protein
MINLSQCLREQLKLWGGEGLVASKYATKHPENVEKNYYI